MSIVTGCRNLVSTLALARNTVLGAVVRELVGDGSSRLVVGVEGAVCSASSVGSSRLLATVECASTEHGRVNARCVDNPWEGGSGRDEGCNESVLHVCGCGSVLDWYGKGDIVEQGDKVLIYLLATMFLLFCDIRFSLHSDRAEGKSNPYLQTAVPRETPPRYQHPRCDQQTLVCIQT